jgi:hypothetical protein
MIDRLRQDVIYGARVLRNAPGFTLTAMLVLVLGIGIPLSAFRVVLSDLHSTSAPDPDSLVHLTRRVLRLEPVLGGRHVTDLPGTIHLVPQAPEFHIVRLFVTVRNAKIRPLRSGFNVAVFEPAARFFRRANATLSCRPS